MESSRPQLVVLADVPDALCELFGISLLERLLRTAQRLGFREAIIVSDSKDVADRLAAPSWARAKLSLSFHQKDALSEILAHSDCTLVVSAGFYYDPRLLETMAQQEATTLLVDSSPPPDSARLWKNQTQVVGGAALLDRNWHPRQDQTTALLDQLSSDANAGRIQTCDAAQQATYVVNLRKHVRPVFFPAPSSELRSVAENFPRVSAQNGVLDFPAVLDAPIQDWIVARLCRTSVTPNQVTFVTMLIGLMVTMLFATGYLWWGVAFAYTIEILDGVDGKLARIKVETTAAGKFEHLIDYFIEFSWWSALAYHFHIENLQFAFGWLLLLVGSDLIDRLAKRTVKRKVGRNLDDVSNIDRFVRCIGGRRNINIWILAIGLALGDSVHAYVLICVWMAATAAVHLARALQIWFARLAISDPDR